MQKLLLTVDRLSTFVGKIFSWCIVGLTLLITWEIFSRYALNTPHDWAFDGMIQMYGMLFMMSGAYTLSKNNMVRGDVLYGFFPPRLQAGLDLTLYFVFFLPGVTALIWAGYRYSLESWAILEHSGITANGPPVYQYKTVIPIAGAFLLLQGIVEIIRCVRCLKEGTVALAAAGCGGGRRGEAEGADARQGRGYRQARRVRDGQERGRPMKKGVWFGLSIMAADRDWLSSS